MGGTGRTRYRRAVAPLCAGLAAAALAAGCGSGGPPGRAPGSSAAAAAPGTPAAAAAIGGAAAQAMPYNLYTHCGIGEARIGGRYYDAVTPLSDGNGNPPAGWGNPYQAGTVTAVSPSEMLFTDQAGHRVLFRLRPGATSFRHVCS